MQKKIFLIILSFTFCFKPQMTFESVQKGKDLEKISEISIDEFFQLWIRNRKKLKFQTNVRSLFEDVSMFILEKQTFTDILGKIVFLKLKKIFYKLNFRIIKPFLLKT